MRPTPLGSSDGDGRRAARPASAAHAALTEPPPSQRKARLPVSAPPAAPRFSVGQVRGRRLRLLLRPASAHQSQHSSSSPGAPEGNRLFTTKRQLREDPWLERFAAVQGPRRSLALSGSASPGRTLRAHEVFSPSKRARAAAVSPLRFDRNPRRVVAANPFLLPPTPLPDSPPPRATSTVELSPRSVSAALDRRSPTSVPESALPAWFHAARGDTLYADSCSLPSVDYRGLTALSASDFGAAAETPEEMAALRAAQYDALVDSTLERLRQRAPSPTALRLRIDRTFPPRRPKLQTFASEPVQGQDPTTPGSPPKAVPGMMLLEKNPAVSDDVYWHYTQEKRGAYRASLARKRVSLSLAAKVLGKDNLCASAFSSSMQNNAGSFADQQPAVPAPLRSPLLPGQGPQQAPSVLNSPNTGPQGKPLPAARVLLRCGPTGRRGGSRMKAMKAREQLSLVTYAALRRDWEQIDTRGKGRVNAQQLCAPGVTIGGRSIDPVSFARIDRESAGSITFQQVLGFLCPTVPMVEIQARGREYEACEGWRKRQLLGEDRSWIETYPPHVLNEACEMFDLLDTGRRGTLRVTDLMPLFAGQRNKAPALTEAELQELLAAHSHSGRKEITFGVFVELVKEAFPETAEEAKQEEATAAQIAAAITGGNIPFSTLPSGNPFTAIKREQLRVRDRLLKAQGARRPGSLRGESIPASSSQ